MQNPSAPAGKELKYARPEFERRFLLAAVPGRATHHVQLVDRYITGTRLRLRYQRSDDTTVVYKLTQKVAQADGQPGLITTIYVDESEYRTLAQLPSKVLRKVRLSVPPFSVDTFVGPLAGLVIGEVEFGTQAEMLAYRPPPDVVIREITGDPRLTCAALAGSDQRRVVDALAAASRP